ncbi:hypothetical protein ACFUMH_12720 [Cellulomonas sp. NPDC057328]|uniref:hypothetical protein n=1 Tax=Cellulomonas sp. NPDC057328 TaxID=3346101 RepID=UPI00364560FC
MLVSPKLDLLEWEAPRALTTARRDENEAEVAVAALVAAVLGIAVAVVIYICSVCQARSYNACLNAVKNYWTRGC